MPRTAPLPLPVALIPLAIAETLTWTCFYYSFPAFLPAWEADLGWGRTEIASAFTAALVLAGLLAPKAGSLIDRGLSKQMFLGAMAVGASLLVCLSYATELWQFWAVWLGIGLVNAACLYEACFAIITVTVGVTARRAITIVTLWAGFAGTISFPSAYLLTEALGWRGAVQVFAGVIVLVGLPLAWVGLNLLDRFRDAPPAAGTIATGGSRAALANPIFWMLALGFTTLGLIHGMLISHIRPILDDRGLAAGTAVLVASMFGPMQVVGRVVMVAVQNRLAPLGMALLCFAGMLFGMLLLNLGRFEPWLALVFVVPYGAAYGIASIVRPVLTAELLGRNQFGAIAGMMAMPYMLGFALGPTLAAIIWAWAGYDLVLVLALLIGLAGLCAILLARQRAARTG